MKNSRAEIIPGTDPEQWVDSVYYKILERGTESTNPNIRAATFILNLDFQISVVEHDI